MPEKIVQLNEEVIKGQIKELVRGSVEETLYELLSRDGAVEEYFRNYDCDPYSLNVMSILFSIVVVASRTDQ